MRDYRIVRPVNSLIFISDPAGGQVPEWQPDSLILHTETCISVACYPEQDGPTKIVLGSSKEVDPGWEPALVCELKTPNGAVVVSSAAREKFLDMAVATKNVSVQIWLNDPRWPDQVTIGIA